ncbi:MAG: sigma 54-interacting transcriptional regulator [Fibrobacteria bacterium]|nr:sigma 54-interacting transcriptional regulator [Fibrobacteria bacterium]
MRNDKEILDVVDTAICRFFNDGQIQFSNQAFLDYFEITSPISKRQNVFKLFPEENQSSFTKRISSLKQHGFSSEFESSLSDKEHNVNWRKWKLTHGTGTGEISDTYLLTGIDITHQKQLSSSLKQTQSELHQLFNLAVPSCVISKSFKILRVNHTFCSLFDLKQEDVLGSNCYDIWQGPFCNKSECPLTQILNGNEKINQEVDLSLRNGRKLTCILKGIPFKDHQNNLIGIIENFTDITERKAFEKRAFELEKMKSIGTLAGGIAHDFNNVLGAILGSAEKVERDPYNLEKVKESMEIVTMACERGGDLVKKLMAFARKSVYKFVETDIHELLEETLALLTHTLEKNITVVKHFTKEKATLKCDQAQIQNVILNLVANSRHAMSQGGTLSIETSLTWLTDDNLGAGKYIKLTVKDTGNGIKEEDKKRIFEPFFSTKNEQGTGFGLASSYGCIKSHKGKIEIESEVNHGTSVHIFLPYHECEVVKQDKHQTITIKPGVQADKEVIIIDDDELLLKMYNSTMEDSGYKYKLFSNSQDAMSYYKDNYQQIGVVVLDMIMPEMGGRDCFFQFREINDDVKTILISGYAPSQDALEVMKFGVPFLTKPVKSEKLLTEIGNQMALVVESDTGTSKPSIQAKPVNEEEPIPASIAVVDDDRTLAKLIGEYLEDIGLKADIFFGGEHMLDNLPEHPYRLVIIDYNMEQMNGNELMLALNKIQSPSKAVLLTGLLLEDGILENAKEAGFQYFLKKPLDTSLLRSILQECFGEQLVSSAVHEPGNHVTIVGKSQLMIELREQMETFSRKDDNIHIHGDAGTGKELFAHTLHFMGKRRNAPYLTINCISLPDNLLENELFGYERKLPDGSYDIKKGLFELAHTGSIYIKGIDHLNYELQARVLNCMQKKKIQRTGSIVEQNIDVRIISSSIRNLEDMVLDNYFSEELFCSIATRRLTLPRLCDRKEDIPDLTDFFRLEYNTVYNKKIKKGNNDLYKTLINYSWPGNVKELKQTLYQVFSLCTENEPTTVDLPVKVICHTSCAEPASAEELSLNRYLESLKKDYLIKLLKRYNNNIPLCAEHAKVNRTSFYHILKKHGISVKQDRA